MTIRDGDSAASSPLPPSGRAIIPILWEVIERWQQQDSVSDWRSARRLLPARHDDWEGLVERIQLINTFQWHEEDRSRDTSAGDSDLASIKRSIDASNRRRIASVEALDELIHDRLYAAGPPPGDAPLHSESLGSIVDRLSVLALKIFHTKAALTEARRLAPDRTAGGSADGPGTEDPDLLALYERVRSVTEQLVDLTGCLDALLDDLQAGRLRMKLYRQIKIYRDHKSGLIREESR